MGKLKPSKMHVLKGDPDVISKRRPIVKPDPPETIMFRGVNRTVPDLVCGSCGAVLATGMPADAIYVAIWCNACGTTNDGVAKN